MALTSASLFICMYRFVPPPNCSDMPQSGCDQHLGLVTVREGANNTYSLPDVAHQPFQRLIGFETAPVLGRHCIVAQRLLDSVFDDLISPGQTHGAQLLDHLQGHFLSCIGIFLRVKRLERR